MIKLGGYRSLKGAFLGCHIFWGEAGMLLIREGNK